MKHCLVTGVSGFIGHHLANRLAAINDCIVTGTDIVKPIHPLNPKIPFLKYDLRDSEQTLELFEWGPFDEVYHLAANMGGMGHIETSPCEIMYDSTLINVNVLDAAAAKRVWKFFFSSSACVYRNMAHYENLSEGDAYPAQCPNEYGWQKLFTERMILAYAQKYGFQPRIARFGNTFGPQGTWDGGREKAPAAMCRKVAMLPSEGGEIEVWGDGSALRSYQYIDDLLNGIQALMESDLSTPVNLGTEEYVTVDQLANMVARVANKPITIKHVLGHVGVASRQCKIDLAQTAIGWKPTISTEEGLRKTYPWISEQVEKQKHQKT